MGYISKENFEKIYIKIRQDSIENNSSVLIFVSPSADSLCAAKVLLTLLKIDNITHQIIPISGWSDLSKANQTKIETNEELRTVIMINCGGLVDLTEFLSLSEILTVYIIDSHRPYNLSNIYSTNQIVIVDDGDIEEDMADIQKAFEELEYDTDSSSSDEETDEEEEEEEEEEIINVEDDENVDTTNLRDNENNNNDNNRKSRKRAIDESIDEYQSRRLKRLRKHQQKQENRRLISDYYSTGSYYGMSASEMLYILATQLARSDINILWLAIIGLTDQYLNGKIGHEKYLIQAQGYREDVLKFSTSVINKKNSTLGINDSENTLSLDESLNTDDIFSFNTLNSGSVNNGPVIAAHTSSSDEILRVEDDYRLMLWRHWSLFEAMYHSSYVATKLGIWRQEGKRKLNELLLKMGFPLNQCQENYTEMDIELKKILPEKLEDMAPMFGLNEMSYPSFVKQHGYKCTLSASDTVYSLNALLNRGWDFAQRIATQEIIPTPFLPQTSSRVTERETMDRGGMVGQPFGNIMDIVDPDAIYHSSITNNSISMNGQSTDDDDDDKDEDWMEGFYMAYDALDNIDLMLYGIKSAIHLQRAIVHTGLTILEHNPSMLLKNFRFVVIGADSVRNGLSNGTSGLGLEDGYGLFGKSVMHLEQLATFLGSAWKEHGNRRSKNSKALVTAAQNDSRDTYLVVGIIPSGLGAVSHTQRNTFGLAFQNTAQRTNARVKHDSFDASVIEVKKEDLKSFIEHLQSSVIFNDNDYI
ncbi:CDC45-like protein [Anaeromyces robustus]|uniref:CDC45-like protein n=1 Tax=Anaeromyces robustus TaxID=1754192 RepID=A0A1Y1X956_9FUNG|nr:CDC45-like protein [Anaeromyces robustus]|eukprot:ORX82277.1 CDC45-like protein [Anaeromyces robustus]